MQIKITIDAENRLNVVTSEDVQRITALRMLNTAMTLMLDSLLQPIQEQEPKSEIIKA